jgi:[ribosomal protein S5]-alanine N-acetyltransferase
MTVVAETTRLVLREFEPGDAEQLHPVFSDPEANRFTLRLHSEVAETLAWIEAIRVGYQKRGYAPWAVVRKADNALLGYCGCGVAVVDGERECEIGYRIIRSCWGQGFATEAVLACIDHVSSKLPFSRLVALIQHGNAASVRVAEKAGMKYERDTVYEGVSMRLHAIDIQRPEALA